MDTTKGKGETGLLTPLFEARLQMQSDMEGVVSAEIQEGELIGSGDGTVTGALRSRASSLVDVRGPLRLCLCASRYSPATRPASLHRSSGLRHRNVRRG